MSDKKVIITCDSTCDLSPALTEQYGIPVNPLFIVMGDGTPKRDGIEATPADIYDYAEATGRLAKTTAPNMDDYLAFFLRYTREGYAIVHFTISASMSAAFNNARLAAAELEDVYIVDSRNLSTGSGLLVLKAAELARKGWNASAIAAEAARLTEYVDTSFVIDTLKYLHKGGRCSAVAALGANLLRLKPCIEVKNGAMGVGKKYRGNLADCFVAYCKDRLAHMETVDLHRIFITHSGCEESVIQRVKQTVEACGTFEEILITRAGCTVSSHCGPGTLGVLFLRKTPVA